MECCRCKRQFKGEIFPWQGEGFAANADADGVSAFFGSRYDLDFMPWTKGREASGAICDGCIAELIQEGKLNPDESSPPWLGT